MAKRKEEQIDEHMLTAPHFFGVLDEHLRPTLEFR